MHIKSDCIWTYKNADFSVASDLIQWTDGNADFLRQCKAVDRNSYGKLHVYIFQ